MRTNQYPTQDLLDFIIAQTRQDTVREVIERMERYQALVDPYVINQLREEYGIKDEGY